ncbi:MAG: hypothetical protein R2787_04485 [Saprospiraceae bacterium]
MLYEGPDIPVPAGEERENSFLQVLNDSVPILQIPMEHLDGTARLVQQLLLQTPEVTRFAFHPLTGQPLRCEIVSIGRPLPEDRNAYQLSGSLNDLWRVDLFNHFLNQTMRVILDVRTRQIVVMDAAKVVQPLLGDHLQMLVHDIAMAQPAFQQVAERLGISSIGGKYHTSRCERSMHLAGAWVWTLDTCSIWALVDLTDHRLLGWDIVSTTDRPEPTLLTERSLENRFVMQEYCRRMDTIRWGDWLVPLTLTGSDGLEIINVQWKGQPVINSAKLVDWHVSYESGDVVGYTDAMGCPQFSSAAVVAFHGPRIDTIWSEGAVIGFRVVQDFRSAVWPYACNYFYQNQFEFYVDGRFRISGVNHGLGCGGNAWYRPVFRMDLCTDAGGDPQEVTQWSDGSWRRLEKESWSVQTPSTAFSPVGGQYRISGGRTGFILVPNQGQFADQSRGDAAFTYIVVRRPGEGEEDLPTLGACCRSDHQQGPETYLLDPEDLNGQHVIIWYVPQMRNDNRPGREYCWATTEIVGGLPRHRSWPGVVGPMFIPIQ